MNLRRRLIYGFIVAAILHVVVLGILPRLPKRLVSEVQSPPMRMIVLKNPPIKHPKPHKRRPPKPVPKPKIVRAKVSPRKFAGSKTRGHIRPKKIVRRAAAPPRAVRRHELVKATPLPMPVASVVPSEIPPVAGNGLAGADTRGPAIDGSGAQGNADEGNGNARTGNGSGDAPIPCGDPEFTTIGKETLEDGMISHEMRVRLHTLSGDSQSEHVPYRFLYQSHEDDPFWRKNHGNPKVLTLVQFPPTGFDRSLLGPVMQTILAHTSAEGITLFPECEGQKNP